MLAVVYLALVWTLSAVIRLLESPPRAPGDARDVALPDWVEPVARYMLDGGADGHAADRRDLARRQHA